MGDLWFFVRLAKPYRLWLIGGGLLSLVALAANIGLLSVAGWLVGAGAIAAGGAVAAGASGASVAIRVFSIVRIVGRYAERIVTHEATFRLLTGFRVWLFEKTLPLAPGRLQAERSGDILNRMTADIDALDNLYIRLLVPTAVAAIVGVTLFVLLASFSLILAVGVIAFFVAAGLLIPLQAHKASRGSAEGQLLEKRTLRTQLIDLFQGTTDLQVYGRLGSETSRADAQSDAVENHQRRLALIGALSTAGTTVLTQLALALTLVVGLALVGADKMGGAVFVFLLLFVLATFEVVAGLPTAYVVLQETKTAAARLVSFASQKSTAPDVSDSDALPLSDDHSIVFDEVTFSYPGQEGAALDGANLFVTTGQKVGLLGPSGSGKTTILSLLLRFYDPTAGKILLGDVPLNRLRHDDLRATVSLLSQKTEIFNTSLRDNLTIARPDADDAALTAAVNQAGLGAFVAGLPNGLDTWLGENGVGVSGGEARRISLARIFLRDTPVLLLDEPTEGLDEETERAVIDSLRPFIKNKTVLVVTHRRPVLQLVNDIYRVSDGKIVRYTLSHQLLPSTPDY